MLTELRVRRVVQMNREDWLTSAADVMGVWLDSPKPVLVSVGFPSKGGLSVNKKRLAECWEGVVCPDGSAQVYVSPVLNDPVLVLAALLHELIHAKIGADEKHGKGFKKEMKKVGLEGPAGATSAGAVLLLRLDGLAATLGPYPHPGLVPTMKEKVAKGSRLKKLQCPGCELTVWATEKTLREVQEAQGGLPWCGVCGVDKNWDSMERLVEKAAE